MTKLAYVLGARHALEKLGTSIAVTLEQTRNACRLKIGGHRVAVTDDQTPQSQSWPIADAARQARSVDNLWEQHDKRQQLFTTPPWPD